METKMAACYVRVSTEEQAQEGFSIAAQEENLVSCCRKNGWVVADIYADEGVSGSTLDRPALSRLRRDAKNHRFSVVLVWKIDRLTRRIHDLSELTEEFASLGIELRSSVEQIEIASAGGRAFLGILGVFAEYERETIRERTRLAIRKRASEGLVQGLPNMIGYRYLGEGRLEVEPEGAAIVRWIFSQYLQGVGTHRLAELLRAADISCLSAERLRREFGSRPQHSVEARLRVIIRNPAYAGYVHIRKEIFPGKHEAIINEQTWREACRLMDSRKEIPNRSHTTNYILSGLITCGQCGGPMYGMREPTRLRDPEERRQHPFYEFYVCGNSCRQHGSSRCCDAGRIRKDEAEQAVVDTLRHLAFHPDDAMVKIPEDDDLTAKKQAIVQSLAQVERSQQKWYDAFEHTPGLEEAAIQRIRDLGEKRKALTDELARVETSMQRRGPRLSRDQVLKYLEYVSKELDHASPDQLREIIRTLVRKVTVVPTSEIYRRHRLKKVLVDLYPLQ